jgi:hypothetical protein
MTEGSDTTLDGRVVAFERLPNVGEVVLASSARTSDRTPRADAAAVGHGYGAQRACARRRPHRERGAQQRVQTDAVSAPTLTTTSSP